MTVKEPSAGECSVKEEAWHSYVVVGGMDVIRKFLSLVSEGVRE